MRLINNFIFSFLTLFTFLSAEEKPIKAGETQNIKDIVILPAGETHDGDYFAYGDNIEISGIVNGDVYLAGGQIFIDGQVLGDVLIAGGSVSIQGEVQNNVRVIAGQATIGGKVGHNVTVVGGNAQFPHSAVIQGSLVCCAGNVELASTIGSSVNVAASNLRISGQIKRNLAAFVGQLRLTSRAKIDGNLEYRSNTVAYIDPGAQVMGTLTHHPTLIQGLFKGKLFQGILLGSKIAGTLMNFFYTLAIGIIMLKVFPSKLHLALEALEKKPWKSWAFGAMLLILLPLVSLILLMTILGIPFALTLLALNVIGFYTAKVFTIFWVSNSTLTRIGLKKNRISTFFVGLICYFLITAIPILGTIVAFVTMLFGLGAGTFGQSKQFS
jgi:hypothetical protein